MNIQTKLRSPIHYMGNKYDLVEEIFKLIPSNTRKIHDIFGGSGVISLNAVYNGLKAFYIERDPNVYSMFKVFSAYDYQRIRKKVQAIIEKFDLPMDGEDIRQRKEGNPTREYYKKNYMDFRQHYNSIKNDLNEYDRACYLWVLSSYSFGKNLRFNKKGEFNMPFGNNPFQRSSFERIKSVNEHSKNIKSYRMDAIQYLKTLPQKDDEIIYLDPPYLNSVAVYNEKRGVGGWDEQMDQELLKILDMLNALGHKWILSNTTIHKDKINEKLIEWSKKYRVKYPKKTYSALGKGNAQASEILVYNFETYQSQTLFMGATMKDKSSKTSNDKHKFKFNQSKIRLFEAFAGIGAQSMALRKLSKEYGFQLETVGISEIDKFALKSYREIHGNVPNFGDISKMETLPDNLDILTYSFPCQDISLAGHGKGLKRGGGTRSGLLWEIERLLKSSSKPKVLLMENVKNLVSKKFKADFKEWQEVLNKMGYTNFWSVLNAKNYGVPQNRERVFMISILGNYSYTFPKGFPLKIRLKDILEDDVDKKYYLSDRAIKGMKNTKFHSAKEENRVQDMNGISATILARDHKDPKVVRTPNDIQENYMKAKKEGVVLNPLKGRTNNGWHFEQQVYDREGISRSVKAGGGSGNIPKVIEKPKIIYAKPLERQGWHNKAKEVIKPQGISTCIHTQSNNLLQKVEVQEKTNEFRIRKFTPKETWRLMGFPDEDFYKAQSVNSNTQLYKQAGNSIVVDVLYYIFKQLFN